MTQPRDMNRLIPVAEIVGEDKSETELLREMAQRAEKYLKSFKWCPSITGRMFGCGVGGVVAVFLFKFATKVGGTDDSLWVIEGDVPSAYLVTDDAPDSASALTVYCDMMDEWAAAVLNGSALESIFPVAAPATSEMAIMLLSRTKFIREQVVPKCQSSIRNQ